MKVLLMTDHYHPGQTSGARLMTELTEGMRAQGIDMKVITADPQDPARPAPVPVSTVSFPLKKTKKTIFRLINEVAFSIRAAMKIRQHGDMDHVLVLASPPFLPIFAGAVCRVLGKKYSVIMMDVYPEMAAQLGAISRTGFIYRIWNALVTRALEQAEGVLVLGRCMEQRIKHKSQRIRTHVIQNWVKGTEVYFLPGDQNPFFAEHPELKGKFIVQYAGNLGMAQDFEPILQAAAKLQDHPDIQFVLIGDGQRREWLASTIQQRKLQNITMLPFQKPEKSKEFLSAMDIALITLEKGVEGLGVPSKFYPILAVGRPIIAVMDPNSEVALNIKDHHFGHVFDHDSTDAIAEAILEIKNHGNAYGHIRQVFEQQFDYPVPMQHYATYLRRQVQHA